MKTPLPDQESANDLRHHFLLAMPGSADPFFANSLAYLIEHDERGAMGVVVNHPSPLCLADVAGQLGVTQCAPAAAGLRIHIGGPVDTNRGFILHSADRQWADTVPLDGELCLSTSRDALVDIAQGEGPQHCLLILGYSGWSAGQLESELAENAWLSLPADEQILFGVPPEARARQAASCLGIDIGHLSAQAGHA